MKRKQYNENRAELDQEAYRDGFLGGYQDGADAAIEYLQTGIFTYDEHGNPVRPDFGFGAEGEKRKFKTKRLAYEIGYCDAFDRGYHDSFKAVDDALDRKSVV